MEILSAGCKSDSTREGGKNKGLVVDPARKPSSPEVWSFQFADPYTLESLGVKMEPVENLTKAEVIDLVPNRLLSAGVQDETNTAVACTDAAHKPALSNGSLRAWDARLIDNESKKTEVAAWTPQNMMSDLIGAREPRMTVQVTYRGYPLQMLVDTGASTSLVDRRALGAEAVNIFPITISPVGLTGHPLKTYGGAKMWIKIRKKGIWLPMIVVEFPHRTFQGILGINALRAFGMVIDLAKNSLHLQNEEIPVYPLGSMPRMAQQTEYATAMEEKGPLPEITLMKAGGKKTDLKQMVHHVEGPTQIQLLELLGRQEEVFAKDRWDIGRINEYTHKIILTDQEPVSCRPYRVPVHLEEKTRECLNKMSELGIIRPSTSPYSAPVVLVKKPDGNIRLCVDFRKLNMRVQRNQYPPRLVDEIFDQLSGSKFFSNVDITSAFWSIPLAEESIPCTAFNVLGAHYEMKVLPFGLSDSPATFQQTVDKVVKGIPNVCCFLDDIVIGGKTEEEHLQSLELLLQALKEAGFKLNLKKSKFLAPSIPFLGHIISSKGIEVDSMKIKAVKEWPRPTSVKTLLGFIGLANYYRKFIPNFSALIAPLTDLSRKKNGVASDVLAN